MGRLDKNPQWLNMVDDVAITTTYRNTQTATPIPRFGTSSKSTSRIIEILKAWFIIENADIEVNAVDNNFVVALRTRPYQDGVAATRADNRELLGEPATLTGWYFENQSVLAGASGLSVRYQDLTKQIDLQSADGHGLLVATDSIFLTTARVTGAAPTQCSCRLLYRFVDVSLQEYIGVVQSQQ